MSLYGPPPSHAVQLSDLRQTATGTKVRFLGCVHWYHASSATIKIGTAFPLDSTIHPIRAQSQPQQPRLQQPQVETQHVDAAVVDVTHIIETSGHLLRVGTWISIIGYKVNSSELKQYADLPPSAQSLPLVQAVLACPAGAGADGSVQVQRHSSALTKRNEAMKAMAAARSQFYEAGS